MSVFPAFARAEASKPPIARLQPFDEILWGERISDPYRWMETPNDRDWMPFLRGQDAFARKTLADAPVRARLLQRIAELSGDIAQVIYPKPAGALDFLLKREAGAKAYRIVVQDAAGVERVLVDPAAFEQPGKPASITWWSPSPDGRYLVFGVALAGSEAAVGHVVEVGTGTRLPELLTDVQYAAPAWLPDGSGFFYNRFAGRAAGSPDFYNDRAAWFHRVASLQSTDRRIMAAGMDAGVPMTPITSPEIQVGIDSDHVVLVLRDGYVRQFALYVATREAVLAGKATWRRICGADDGIADFALSGDKLFLVSTNKTPRGALLQLDVALGTLASAGTVLPTSEAVLDELNAGRNGVFITMNDGGEQSLAFMPLSGTLRRIALPYTGWIQSVAVAPREGAALVRITSWLEPGTVFSVDAKGAAMRSELQGRPAIDLTPYETRRVFAMAKDGTKVPISVIARKGRPVRAAPCIVHVYGAYQWPSQPIFDARAIAFLEEGGVIATAHVRGGGEYGRAWHLGGQKATKPNSWRDLIACCETLISQGYTSARQLAIFGGSAGGIAVGRAMIERPDLFAAVISKVSMSNPLRAEFEPNGQPNVPEFGSVKDEAGFRALKEMDSYNAVRDDVRYPAVLLTTSINDARVAPHNAAKMSARLQAANPKGLTLLRVDFEGGHDMNNLAKAQADAEYADEFTFVLQQVRHQSRKARS